MVAQMPKTWHSLEAIKTMTVERARATIANAQSGGPLRLPRDVQVEEIEIAGAADIRPGRIYRPDIETPAGTVMWIGGGGFVIKSRGTETFLACLASASGCVVVNVEYRLAPEHPYPAAPEDCYAALRWVNANSDALAGASRGLAVGGDSAGGNLAAVIALMARDRGGPKIALQVLLYPMTACTFPSESRQNPEVSATGRPEGIDWLWSQYLGDADGSEPYASPLHSENLTGLPSALVITAEYDALRDEGEAYAKRLGHAGVPVDMRRYDGMHHGFAEYPDAIDAGADCMDHMARAFREALLAMPND